MALRKIFTSLVVKLIILLTAAYGIRFFLIVSSFFLAHMDFAVSIEKEPIVISGATLGLYRHIPLLLFIVAGVLAWHHSAENKHAIKPVLSVLLPVFLMGLSSVFLIVFRLPWAALICTGAAAIILLLFVVRVYPLSKVGMVLMIPYLVYIGYSTFLIIDFAYNDGQTTRRHIRPSVERSYPALNPKVEKLPPVTIKGKQYRTIRFDSLTWMADNLNYELLGGSFCYENDTSFCRQYGRLYTWEAAVNACREVGWRLPTDKEWESLIKSFGSDAHAYTSLFKGGDTLFNGLLGGSYYSPEDKFADLENMGSYWSSNGIEPEDSHAFKFAFRRNRRFISRDLFRKEWAFSCRCVMD